MQNLKNNFNPIVISYDHTFNIIPFYKKVCNFLVQKEKEKYLIYSEIEKLYKLMNNDNKDEIRRLLNKHSKSLTILEKHGDFHNYNNDILSVIEKYKKLCLTTEITLKVDVTKTFNENKEKIHLVDTFFNITKKYFPITLKRKFKEILKCDICGGMLKNTK